MYAFWQIKYNNNNKVVGDTFNRKRNLIEHLSKYIVNDTTGIYYTKQIE